MDRLTPERRSALMAKVRGKNTSPEIAVRKLLWRMGIRYRLHVKALPGSPDIVLKSRMKIVLVHGCFWHGHKGCSKAKPPETRRTFWREKLTRNVQRDSATIRKLRRMGWSVLVVWQCEIKTVERLTRKLNIFLPKIKKTVAVSKTV